MDIASYQSPFSWRYGTRTMREVWSEQHKRELWRRAWLLLLRAQGHATAPQVASFDPGMRRYDIVDWDAAMAEEKKTKHDLVAEMNVFACILPPELAAKLHTGVTSSDIEDYADEIILREAVAIIRGQAAHLCRILVDLGQKHLDKVILGKTHLQNAEPTLLANRWAWYLSQIIACGIFHVHEVITTKGMHGAVGSSANLDALELSPTSRPKLLEYEVPVFQTRSRFEELQVTMVLSQLAAILHKMGMDLRLMHTDGLAVEGKSEGQVGSSAMPTKTNPISAEKLCGLARLLPGFEMSMWQMAANTLLERTLDDSSTRRVVEPEIFLTISEALNTAIDLLNRLTFKNDDDCMDEVLESWYSWLPSRVLAILKNRDSVTLHLHKDVEVISRECSSGQELLDEFNIKGLPHEYLYLGKLRVYLNRYLSSAKKYTEML